MDILGSVPEVKKVLLSMGERRGSHVRQFLPLHGISDTVRQKIAAKGWLVIVFAFRFE